MQKKRKLNITGARRKLRKLSEKKTVLIKRMKKMIYTVEKNNIACLEWQEERYYE